MYVSVANLADLFRKCTSGRTPSTGRFNSNSTIMPRVCYIWMVASSYICCLVSDEDNRYTLSRVVSSRSEVRTLFLTIVRSSPNGPLVWYLSLKEHTYIASAQCFLVSTARADHSKHVAQIAVFSGTRIGTEEALNDKGPFANHTRFA